jgi:hypothetical protein
MVSCVAKTVSKWVHVLAAEPVLMMGEIVEREINLAYREAESFHKLDAVGGSRWRRHRLYDEDAVVIRHSSFS